MEKEQTLEKLKEKHTNLRVELTIIENNVSENTTEEIEARLKEIEEKLEGFKKRAQAVLRVKKEFEKVVEEMDSETFIPLVSSFVGYLAPLTASRYKSSSMDGALPSGIMKDSGGGKCPLICYLLELVMVWLLHYVWQCQSICYKTGRGL